MIDGKYPCLNTELFSLLSCYIASMKSHSGVKKINIFVVAVFMVYLLINIVAGSHIGEKELQDQYRHLSVIEWDKIYESHNAQTLTKLRKIFIPVWRFNRYIYPSFIILIALLFYQAKYRNQKE